MKEQIKDFINEVIELNYGTPIGLNNKLVDSGIDSFGIAALVTELDAKYCLLEPYSKTDNIYEKLDIYNITMKQLVDKCAETFNEYCKNT